MTLGRPTAWLRAASEDEVAAAVETPTRFEDFFAEQQRALLAFLRRRTGNVGSPGTELEFAL